MFVCVYILQVLLLKRLILQGLQKKVHMYVCVWTFLCKPRQI